MPRIVYKEKRFSAPRLEMIENANAICAEYAEQGLVLTLRQLYYQFVARDLIANKQSEYKRLGDVCADARMAGMMDWDYLIDRTRNLAAQPHWASPGAVMRAAAQGYNTDRWAEQETRVQVWIEKDAGIGVIEGVCNEEDVPYFSCRGYTSMSELWASAQRIGATMRGGQNMLVLHIGDHDPSGLDMSRDIEDRLREFIDRDSVLDLSERVGTMFEIDGIDEQYPEGTQFADFPEDVRQHYIQRLEDIRDAWGRLEIKRIALNYDQVEQYQPPPNPAKQTDSRFERYVEETGLYDSWELDALEPTVLRDLIRNEIEAARDETLWEESTDAMETERTLLTTAARRWPDVATFLTNGHPTEES